MTSTSIEVSDTAERSAQGERPWLSVIIPTFNGESFLREALASVEQQARAGVEVIVVDDGSTDGSLALIRSFAARMPLVLVANEHRGNWVASSNEGVRRASGEWITFLHQDDGWAPGRVARLRAVIEQHPELQFVVHDAWFADGQSRFVGAYEPALRAERVLAAADALGPLIVQNTIAISCVAFRRDAYLRVGAMDEAWRYTADWKLWLHLMSLGCTYRIAEPLGFFRIHMASQTTHMSKSSSGFLAEQRHVQEEFTGLVEQSIARAGDYLTAARLSSYGNAILAAAWEGKYRGCVELLRELGMPSSQTVLVFMQCSRLGQRTAARLRAFLVGKLAGLVMGSA
jgi:glycosyltransferase involved in cell wall biosynthesis